MTLLSPLTRGRRNDDWQYIFDNIICSVYLKCHSCTCKILYTCVCVCVPKLWRFVLQFMLLVFAIVS